MDESSSSVTSMIKMIQSNISSTLHALEPIPSASALPVVHKSNRYHYDGPPNSEVISPIPFSNESNQRQQQPMDENINQVLNYDWFRHYGQDDINPDYTAMHANIFQPNLRDHCHSTHSSLLPSYDVEILESALSSLPVNVSNEVSMVYRMQNDGISPYQLESQSPDWKSPMERNRISSPTRSKSFFTNTKSSFYKTFLIQSKSPVVQSSHDKQRKKMSLFYHFDETDYHSKYAKPSGYSDEFLVRHHQHDQSIYE
jgi:hypothetical protein